MRYQRRARNALSLSLAFIHILFIWLLDQLCIFLFLFVILLLLCLQLMVDLLVGLDELMLLLEGSKTLLDEQRINTLSCLHLVCESHPWVSCSWFEGSLTSFHALSPWFQSFGWSWSCEIMYYLIHTQLAIHTQKYCRMSPTNASLWIAAFQAQHCNCARSLRGL